MGVRLGHMENALVGINYAMCTPTSAFFYDTKSYEECTLWFAYIAKLKHERVHSLYDRVSSPVVLSMCCALVICNHGPHSRGIAGTFTFVLQIHTKSPALWGKFSW